jgi:hypothetical protein
MEKIHEVSNTAKVERSFAKWTYFQTDSANPQPKGIQ